MLATRGSGCIPLYLLLCKLLIALVRRWQCRPDSPGQVRPCYVTFVAEAEGKGTSFPSQLIMRGLSLALAKGAHAHDQILYCITNNFPSFWRTPSFLALDSVVYILYFMLYIYTCYSTVSLTEPYTQLLPSAMRLVPRPR
jgi:hypothetical protein